MDFSVIIPVYNKKETVSESIESVLNQKYKNFEIIVINDGSTDNTSEILEKYKNKIKIINQKNSGVSVARNNGIKKAKGKFICFLDADDIWFDNHLETLDKMIKEYKNESYFITSRITTFNNNAIYHSSSKLKKFPQTFKCKNLFKLLNVYGDGLLQTNSICIKKDAFIKNNIFFEPNIKIGEDTDVWYRVALKFPVIISKTETNIYRKEYSTATKKTSNDYDWIFSKRIQKILNDKNIPNEIKNECQWLIDRYNLACVRDYIYDKNKKKAKDRIKTIKNKKNSNYVITKILTILPLSIARKIYCYKYKKD